MYWFYVEKKPPAKLRAISCKQGIRNVEFNIAGEVFSGVGMMKIVVLRMSRRLFVAESRVVAKCPDRKSLAVRIRCCCNRQRIGLSALQRHPSSATSGRRDSRLRDIASVRSYVGYSSIVHTKPNIKANADWHRKETR